VILLIRVVDLEFGILSMANRRIFRFGIWELNGFHPILVLIWKWEPDETLIWFTLRKNWQPDEYVIRLSF